MSAPVALVTGASGAVGPALVARLLQEGYSVRVLSRGHRPAPWPGAVEERHGDVVDRVAVAGAVAGVDLVFHLAGLLHVTRPTPALTREYERVNVEGARVVAEESTRAGVSRLVLFSTIAVYGPTGPEGADEDTLPRPDSPYAQTKLRAEQAVCRLDGTAELRTSVLRLAAVYGPRVTGNYARLAGAIRSGWFLPVGEGLNRRTLVHEADVAEAALLAARSPRAAGRLYNVSDGDTHRLRDVLEAMCLSLGRPYPRFRLPIGPVRAVAKAGDALVAPFGAAPRLSSALDKYTEDVAVRAERIRRELGFRPRFDLRSGWSDAFRARPE